DQRGRCRRAEWHDAPLAQPLPRAVPGARRARRSALDEVSAGGTARKRRDAEARSSSSAGYELTATIFAITTRCVALLRPPMAGNRNRRFTLAAACIAYAVSFLSGCISYHEVGQPYSGTKWWLRNAGTPWRCH